MRSAAAVRREVESSLEQRVPGALTPRPRVLRDVLPSGVSELDTLLAGGLPVGAITEFVGPQSSGRTTLALSVLAELTAAGKVVAWIDASDALDPESAAAAGVDLSRQLWVRCGARHASAPAQLKAADVACAAPLGGPALLVEGSQTPAPSGGGGSPHPRGEARGLSEAIDAFLQQDTFARAITPRGPDLNRLSSRKDKSIGTPGAQNRKLTGSPASGGMTFPRCAPDREEQVASDRLPSRRKTQMTQPERRPRNLAAEQIAHTGAVAGAWNDNRNNAAGRSLQTAPKAIAAGLPRFREMEARANGQGLGLKQEMIEWKPSLEHLGQKTTGGLRQSVFQAPEPPQTECAEQAQSIQKGSGASSLAGEPSSGFGKPVSPVWIALDQALRATDLLLAAGGFSAIVLDLGSIAPEFAWRIPLATWFRFRAGAERVRTVFILLTQHPCARSSADLVLSLSPAEPQAASTVLTGACLHVSVDRQRFVTEYPEDVTSAPEPRSGTLHLVTTRKPPQPERAMLWQRRSAWAGDGR